MAGDVTAHKARLGDLASFVNGDRGENYPSPVDFVEEGIPFVSAADITDGRVAWSGTKRITPEKYASLRAGKIEAGDLLFCLRGSLGKIARIDEVDRAAIASSLVIIRPKAGVDRNFIYYVLSSSIGQRLAADLDNGSVQPNISVRSLQAAEVPTAPLQEQRAIAQVLGTLDDKIELNCRMNETLASIARAIFNSWFVAFDPVRAKASGESPESICRRLSLTPQLLALFPDRLVDSEVGEIPQGWAASSLGEVIDIFDSKRVPLSNREREKRRGPYPYYGAASVMDQVDDYLFEGVHVLMGEDGSVMNNDSTPVLQYVWGKFWVNNHAHVLRARPPFSDEQLLLFLQQTNIASLVTGAVQPKLSQANLRRIEFIRAPDAINESFGRLVGPTFELIRSRIEENRRLSQIRDALLPELLTRRVRVPHDDAA